jgi:hemolysin III
VRPPWQTNEYFNALSHLIGAILSVSALVVLVTLASIEGKAPHIVGFALYGTTLVVVFIFSTMLHFSLALGRYKRTFEILDHCAIYLMIAGTYTPFCLTLLAGARGWLLFAIVWSLAAFWIVLKAVLFTRMSDAVSGFSYLSMGWLAVFFIAPLYNLVGIEPILLLLAGGIVYTIGAVIFQIRRPNPFPPYFASHEIWHIAVLIATGLFFCVMLFYVLPYPQ